ncbi:Condensin complex non-SMC subunit Cnd3 [Schizosaccharomyces pombe]
MSCIQIISSSQTSIAGHRKLCNKLFTLRTQEGFETDILRALNIILTVKKGNSNADRVLRFLVTFVNYLQQKDPEIDIVQPILKHILRGLDAKDKTVRYRCCQIIARVVNCVKEIDDDLYNTLKEKLLSRVLDRESIVRLEAVVALSRLQEDTGDEENDVRNILLFLLQNDPSSEVRRSVLLNIEVSNSTLPFILERARDVDAANRKCVYARVLPKIGDFRYLSIKKRVRILKWGLNDRDESVEKAAADMLAYQWIENADNNLLELLERLDVSNNSDVAVLAIKKFFDVRVDSLSQLEFPEQFWLELTAESSLLARTFNEICIEKNYTDLLDKMPEVVQLTYYIERQYVSLRDKSSYDESCFIIEQLLYIGLSQDMVDEIGRRKLLKSLTNSLSTMALPDSLISLHIELLRKLCSSENDFCSLLVEIITEVFEQGHSQNQTEEQGNSNAPELNKNDYEGEEITVSQKSPSPSLPPNELNEPEPDDMDGYKEAFNELRCLSYVQCLFENITSSLNENLYMVDMLKTLIIPAVRSHDLPIREKGLECLSLVCLLNADLAFENVPLYLHCYEKGSVVLKCTAIRTLTDMLIQHGKAKFTEYEDAISSILFEALGEFENAELQTLGAEAIAKLLVILHYRDELFLKPLIIQYFEPNTVDNHALRQVLGYFFPVYAFGAHENQWRIATIFCDALLSLLEIYRDLDEDDVQLSIGHIAQQMLDWTDNEKLYERKTQTGDDYIALNHNVHLHLANMIFESLPNASEGKERKFMISLLGKLKIPTDLPSSDYQRTKRKLETYESHGFTMDSTSLSILAKFERMLLQNEEARSKFEETEEERLMENAEENEHAGAEAISGEIIPDTVEADMEDEEEVYVKQEEDL